MTQQETRGTVASAGVCGARVWTDGENLDGGYFSEPSCVRWSPAGIVRAADSDHLHADTEHVLDGTGTWLIPGLVDAHLHASWHAFAATDREQLGEHTTRELTAAALQRTLAAGVTRVRDAGGLSPELLAGIPATQRPDVELSISMIDRAAAARAGGLEHAAAAAIDAGATWVKVVATAGVASAVGVGLEPFFTEAELRRTVALADRSGVGVMAHAWGGEVIDFATSAGVRSIEHGMFMTVAQAKRAAEHRVVLVPTLVIYRRVAAMIAAGDLPRALTQRVAEAVAAHPATVRTARDAGMQIALGTDFGTTEQHARQADEWEALHAAGLSGAAAVSAATTIAAQLVSRGTDPLAGHLVTGARADAVLLSRDPRLPGVLGDPAARIAVVRDGRVFQPSARQTSPSESSTRSIPFRKDHQ